MDESPILAAFRAKFQVEELLVASTAAWSWSVRPGQPTLGAGILSLKRYAANFADVTAAEMAELGELVTKVESAVKAAFEYNIINYLMLMMVDHQVHFHVVPRYDGTRQFAGLEWVDTGWPALPALSDSQYRDQHEVLVLIRDALRSASAS